MQIPMGKPKRPAPTSGPVPQQPVVIPQSVRPPATVTPVQTPAPATQTTYAPPLKRGFTQLFGLDIRVAILAVLVDFLAFGGSIATLGALYVVELGAGIALIFITYKIQRAWYGDDHDSALIKGLVIGLITAIPAPITWIVAGPGGVIGLIHQWWRRR